MLMAFDETMEEIKPNPILKFNESQLQSVRKTVDYEDVNKLKQDLELLIEWIQKQNHFGVKEFGMYFVINLCKSIEGIFFKNIKVYFEKLGTAKEFKHKTGTKARNPGGTEVSAYFIWIAYIVYNIYSEFICFFCHISNEEENKPSNMICSFIFYI